MKIRMITFCCILQLLQATDGFAVPESSINPFDRSSNRIVGGRPAPDGHAHFQSSLQVYLVHHCGCSILSDKWVLTAAHCVSGISAATLSILVGTNNWKKGGSRYQVDKHIVHENYDSLSNTNDIAVVRVNGFIAFNGKVQPIEYSREEVPDNTILELTGWGKTAHWLDESPENLQLIELNALNFEKCKEIWSDLTPSKLNLGQICTFTRRGEGACFGDSGGPLVWRRDSKVQLIGIPSFAITCAKGYPDVYTRVSYYYDWIKKHTS